jgi:putative transposase
MDKPTTHPKPRPTIWEIPDEVWPMSHTMLDDQYPAQPKGHRRVDLRHVMNGILLRLRTGCPWNQLPKQFGDDSTVHRPFQHWCHQGLFEPLWAVLVDACPAWGGVDGQWQAADAMRGNARMGGDLGGRNPTARGQKG